MVAVLRDQKYAGCGEPVHHPAQLARNDGRPAVAAFIAERVLATPWRVRPAGAVNGRPAVLGEQLWDGQWRPGALMILYGERDQITWLATFVGPQLVGGWLNDLGLEDHVDKRRSRTQE